MDAPREPAPPAPPVPFEERLAALEGVVRDLEREDVPLEAAIERYREGVEHVRACRALLDQAEARLVELMQESGADGAAVRERSLRVTERGLEPDASGAS